MKLSPCLNFNTKTQEAKVVCTFTSGMKQNDIKDGQIHRCVPSYIVLCFEIQKLDLEQWCIQDLW